MKKMITIENLNKSFKDVKAVQDLSFSVEEGSFFAFLGVNGAGKSTTINIMCGQLEKDSGTVVIDGADPSNLIWGNYFVGSEWLYYAYIVLIDVFAGVNIGLAVFNLLPIPPLDGSRIFSAILPDKWVYYMNRYEQYIMMGLFLLLFTRVLNGPLNWLQDTVSGAIGTLFGMPGLL